MPGGRPVGTVAASLAAAGRDVRNVAGGMLAWEQEGLTLVAGDGGAGRTI